MALYFLCLGTLFSQGDSCFNSGMKQITSDTAKHAGVYGVCVPTGDSMIMDTINGFLMNMDKVGRGTAVCVLCCVAL